MDRRIVDGYEFAGNGVRAAGASAWAVVSARLIDETTDEPLQRGLRISADQPGLQQRILRDGLVGLVGNPALLFRVPDPALNAHAFSITVQGEGYLPMTRPVSLGPIAGFPDTVPSGALPRPLGNLPLHHRGAVIAGRVMIDTTPRVPAVGAAVSVTAIMRKVTAASMSPVPDPFVPVSLAPHLYLGRAAGTHCRVVATPPSADPEKRLEQSSPAGSVRMRLSDVQGLSVGDVLEVDVGHPASREFLTIADIHPVALPTSPGDVVLDYPSAFFHRRQARVRKVQPQPPAADNTVGVAAIPGDCCLLMDSAAGYSDGDVIEIAGGGPAAPEYHSLALFSVLTDGDGYFSLPMLNRVGQLNLHAELGLQSAEMENFVPDYKQRQNTVDLMIV
jgi:hypothetical protein